MSLFLRFTSLKNFFYRSDFSGSDDRRGPMTGRKDYGGFKDRDGYDKGRGGESSWRDGERR